MADYSLADMLQGREPQVQTIAMPPEEFGPEMARHAKAFGYGLVDPLGLTGYGARGVAHLAPGVLSPETARGFADRSWKAQMASPVASAMSGMIVPGLGVARAAGHLTAREAARGAPLFAALGGGVQNMIEGLKPAFTGENSFPEWRDRRYGPMPVLPSAPY